MVLGSLFGTRKARHGAAAGVVVLATGGLFLLRAHAATPPGGGPGEPVAMNPLTTTPLPPLPPPPRPLVPLADGPVGPDTVAFAGPHIHGTMAVSDARVLAGSPQAFYADVTLNADGPGQPSPLAMVVVLDTSGSMDGAKLNEAKTAVKELVRTMHDDDDIAFVHYSDHADTVQPLRRVGQVRAEMDRAIDSLTANGGTNIPAGLELGMHELEAGLQRADTRDTDRVRRVVLVSDGLDSYKSRSQLLAQNSATKEITVSSMGIGLDFDEAYMGGVARSGHGNFGFVNDEPTLTAFLKRELIETATTVAQGTVAHLHLPVGVRLVKATGADAEVHGRDVDLRVGAIFADEAKRVLLQLETDLPAGALADFSGSLTWRTAGRGAASEAEATIPQLEVRATNDTAAIEKSQNQAVLVRVASVLASERQLEAAQAYANGDAQRAQHLIQANVLALKTAGAAAPAPLAAPLEAQAGSYEHTMKDFASAAPASPKGRFAAKASAVSNVKNASAGAF